MNILLLMSSPRSHITLVEVLIRELINKQNVVYCMSTSNNKDMLESMVQSLLNIPIILFLLLVIILMLIWL